MTRINLIEYIKLKYEVNDIINDLIYYIENYEEFKQIKISNKPSNNKYLLDLSEYILNSLPMVDENSEDDLLELCIHSYDFVLNYDEMKEIVKQKKKVLTLK